ncbi:hypothetical protein ACSLMO_13395 [Flavobacterium columnare]|uniref:hypothetical protein n=1 Tax=Flavobacterium columnare TaxID=996 RepID=UPI004034C0D2
MSIVIEPKTDHESYLVNGKEVYKNSYNHWFSPVELTTQERKAFELYKLTVIDNKAFKKHTKATYKT